jgi:uncharacterized protein YdbL (DUF1318 family)
MIVGTRGAKMMDLKMLYSRKTIVASLAAVLLVGGIGVAVAQTGGTLVSAALAAGDVGEQADGYLGFRETPSSALRAEVDAINIKRKAAYISLATQRGVTPNEFGAAIGCETLATRVATGRAYKLPDGVWRVKGAAPIALPAYCKPS